MPVGPQLPIRLTVEQDRRLKAVAARTGASKSSLIRLLIDTFLDQCVQADGGVSLPPNWLDLLLPADGRSQRPEPTPKQAAAITAMRLSLNSDADATMPAAPPKKVDYRKAIAADKKKRRKS